MIVAFTICPACAVPPKPLSERPALISKRIPGVVLLAVTNAGGRLVAVGEHGIILLSDDNGRSWRQARVPVSVTLAGVRFVSPRRGWAVGHRGVVLHTEDGGETWQTQLSEARETAGDDPDKPLFDLRFIDAGRGFLIGAYGTILATRDGGKTWIPWDAHLPDSRGRHLYGIEAAGGMLFLAGEQGALYRSADQGQSFTALGSPYAGSFFGIVSVAGSLIVYGLNGNAFRSEDAGAHWQRIATGSSDTLTVGLALSDASIVVAGAAGSVLYSKDQGRSFHPVAVSRPFSFTGLAQAADGSVVLCGAAGVMRIEAGGLSMAGTRK